MTQPEMRWAMLHQITRKSSSRHSRYENVMELAGAFADQPLFYFMES